MHQQLLYNKMLISVGLNVLYSLSLSLSIASSIALHCSSAAADDARAGISMMKFTLTVFASPTVNNKKRESRAQTDTLFQGRIDTCYCSYCCH